MGKDTDILLILADELCYLQKRYLVQLALCNKLIVSVIYSIDYLNYDRNATNWQKHATLIMYAVITHYWFEIDKNIRVDIRQEFQEVYGFHLVW